MTDQKKRKVEILTIESTEHGDRLMWEERRMIEVREGDLFRLWGQGSNLDTPGGVFLAASDAEADPSEDTPDRAGCACIEVNGFEAMSWK
jgi:hypothetical protein